MRKSNSKFNEVTEEDYNKLIHELNVLKLAKADLERKLRATEDSVKSFQASVSARQSFNEEVSRRDGDYNRYIKKFLETCPDIVLVFDKNHGFLFGTDSVLGRIGINTENMRGADFVKLFETVAEKKWVAATDKKIKETCEEDNSIFYNEKIKFVTAMDFRYYDISIIPLSEHQGEKTGVIFTMRDTTDLVLSKTEAETANRAKSLFLANISNEIRAPLYAIIGLNELIGKEPLSEKQQSYLDSIKKSSGLLLNIVSDILDLSKIESERLEILSSAFNLREFINNLAAAIQESAEAKDLVFEAIIADDAPLMIESDENKLKQILLNILQNAVQHTHQGKISFFTSCRKDRLCFDISDTSAGLKPDELKKLFVPFERAGHKKALSGSGLELSIAKKLCDLIGGEISVKSKYSLGSTFTVSFPLESISPDSEEFDDIAFTAETANVLVVDDININLTIVEVQLSEFGISPLLASNGQRAVDAVKANDFDLILMDQMMPEMDGMEATAKIREMGGKYERIPIIALTANASGGAKESSLSSGFTDFLTKPVDSDVLRKCLLKWLPPHKIKEIKETD